MRKKNLNPSPAQDRRPSPQCGEGVVLYSFPPLHIMGRGLGGGVLTKFLALIMSLVLFAACAKRALPEEKVRGFAKFALNGGAAISQANSDEYNPYVIQMGDNYLVLVFGSNRSCGGCSGHNLFIAKSVSAYNNNSVFPAFNSPTVMTVASTPLNYSARINFAVTAVGNNVRIHLTNAGGTVQATPNIAPDGPYDTTLATIANASGQTGTVIGYSNGDDKIISRQGSTINAYSRLAAYPLTAIPDAGSATTIAAVDSTFTSRYDGFFALVGGQITSMSYYGSGGKINAVNTAIVKSKITPQSMTLMQGGGTTGPLMFISGTEAGGTSEDLFVVDGLTVWQMWQDLEPKPPGAPAGGGGGGADTTPPTIVNVSSSTADGSYKSGQNINVQVVFSESVNVVVGGGAIYFAMAVPTSWNATCSSGSGTNTMNCTYTVSGAHNTADLDYLNTTAISLIAGATIKDAAGNNAVLTLPAPGGAGSLAANKNIVIDTTAPTISATAPASSTGVNNTKVSYTLSETVASGSITWTRTSGTADAASPHVQTLTGTELNSGAHSNITLTNNPTLVNGTIYSVAFNSTDAAGNAATTVTNNNITYSTTPGSGWSTVNGLPASASWKSIAFGNGVFVAVGNGTTTAARSADGVTWTSSTLPALANWQTVTYANSTFVAIANSSTSAATSPDGITWTAQTVPLASWQSVTYGNGVFLAVAAGTVAATSPNGVTWTSRTLPTSRNWTSVAYGNSTFVVVADNTNGAATSPDGITWTNQTMSASAYWTSINYAGSLFIAVAGFPGTTGATSPDGITWTSRTMPSSTWKSVTYGNGYFIAVGSGGPNYAMNSPDAITWTAQTLSGGSNWLSVAYGNSVFAAINTGSNAAATSQ